jgi:Mn2+/Fe2+ NRAMP family transporter
MRWFWRRRSGRRFIPGLITGSADNDPSGISTYSVAGAQFGYAQMWIMVLATPMLIAVQAMVAKIGDVTRMGLAAVIRKRFPRSIAWLAAAVLVVANVVTIGADLAGMGAALGLIFGTGFAVWVVPLALLVWAIVTFEGYRRLRRLLVALSAVFLAYVLAAVLAKPDWVDVLRSAFVPAVSSRPLFWASAVALLGTTITPYLFFWQAREEAEEHHPVRLAARQDALLAPGFIFSNCISLAIMVATGTVLFGHGGIATAADAARALEPLAGPLSSWLFAVGILGAGLLAVPVLAASTAYVVAESAGWKEGLGRKPKNAQGFYAVLGAAILLGLAIALSGLDPIRALFYSQVVVGFLAPFLLVLILRLASDRSFMGGYAANRFERFFGWLTVFAMSSASVTLLFTL